MDSLWILWTGEKCIFQKLVICFRYMYWLNKLHTRVERAWMDGRHLDRLPFHEKLNEQQIASLGALTLDPTHRLLFYTRQKESQILNDNNENSEIIMCILHNRESCKVLVSGVRAAHLAVFKVCCI
jgi:hypothetical protein